MSENRKDALDDNYWTVTYFLWVSVASTKKDIERKGHLKCHWGRWDRHLCTSTFLCLEFRLMILVANEMCTIAFYSTSQPVSSSVPLFYYFICSVTQEECWDVAPSWVKKCRPPPRLMTAAQENHWVPHRGEVTSVHLEPLLSPWGSLVTAAHCGSILTNGPSSSEIPGIWQRHSVGQSSAELKRHNRRSTGCK